MKIQTVILSFVLLSNVTMLAQEDPYIWLEEVDGKKALKFVETHNQSTLSVFKSHPKYKEIYDASLDILNSSEKIAYPGIRGEYVYNFWQDENHARGIWRRTKKSDYLAGEFNWETLIDVDQLSQMDNQKWVFKGATAPAPDYDVLLVSLSPGGGDAVVRKEFDPSTKTFIEDGFVIEASKGGANYLDRNTLLVACDFGENTMTTSGYPNQVKVWKRGTSLNDAKLLFEGDKSDVGTFGYVIRNGDKSYGVITRAMTFYTAEYHVLVDDEIIKLDIPEDANVSGLLGDQIIVDLKSDWSVQNKTYKQGSLLSLNFEKLLKGQKEVSMIYMPDEFSSVSSASTTKNRLVVNILSNVTSQLYSYQYKDGAWSRNKIKAPDFGSINVIEADESSDLYFINYSNFLIPSTLYIGDASQTSITAHQSLQAYFDASPYEVKQHKAKSKDGTMVPYFVVKTKNMKYDGKNPTLLNAYGGFEVSRQPFYSGTIGRAWLDNGGVFVLANIRGGGEFGPKWHQAGLKENRQRVYDDFHAVAEDLIARNVTSGKHLGIMGGSNGGLLVGVAFTQRPELYNAVVCQVPLLDMKRFNKLLAGASWMGEYGNPDIPEEWAYISKYSPYHNLKADMNYPEVYFFTSTRDDRVHPGHARKMVAKMEDMGYKVYYFENTEGGHAGSSTNDQRAMTSALQYVYLLMKLKG